MHNFLSIRLASLLRLSVLMEYYSTFFFSSSGQPTDWLVAGFHCSLMFASLFNF